MAGEVIDPNSTEEFEYMLFEGDPDNLKPVVYNSSKISPWIDQNALKLAHRIGRGPFGDVWLSTLHRSTKDYEQYHEVATKMMYPIKDDQIKGFLAKFDDVFAKCQGLENACYFHGVSVLNGRICVVMKFYEGSVGDKMARLKGGKLSISDVLRYGADIAQAILDVHSKGILVMNLKPCNFLLNEHNHAILGDIGIPFLLHGLSLPNENLIQRLGTPNYMSPEQWEPEIRGPISYETDSWGFGCSILEMLTGHQPWCGKSYDEIYRLVVKKQEKPHIPTGLPPKLEDLLSGCFEYDFRDRPLMAHVLEVFERISFSTDDESWHDKCNRLSHSGLTDWSLVKDTLQLGDIIRSRKPKDIFKPQTMIIHEGTIVGLETKDPFNTFALIKVHGFQNPIKVHSSTVERVTFNFCAGDFIRTKHVEESTCSKVGMLHSVDRDGKIKAGFIGEITLRSGYHFDFQMAESYNVGQFVRVKENITSPRFEWARKKEGSWATGKIIQVLPNGCLVVKFPGMFSFGETASFLADPDEVEVVSFDKCEGVVKKYEHLEDFHWAVRPIVIALGLVAALKLGHFVKRNVVKERKIVTRNIHTEQEVKKDVPKERNVQWMPHSVASILFGGNVGDI